MSDSKVNIPAGYFRTDGEAPKGVNTPSFESFFEPLPDVSRLLPEHVVVGSEVSIDLGNQMMADGTPVEVVRTTVDKMMPKRMLSPGISIEEGANENVQGMRRMEHSARINLLNEKDRENFDEVMAYMREDHRTESHIRRVQESLLDKAGIPTFYFIVERPHPMELYGHWFDPTTGKPVDNPNVTYRKHELVNNQFDRQYNQNLRDILATGEERTDRTGVRTLSKFGSIKHTIDLREGFPATTGKKFAFNTNKGETMDWMLKGKFDLKSLKDLGIRIWDQNVIPGTEVYEGKPLELVERLLMLGKNQQKVMNDFMEEIGVPFLYVSNGGRDFQLSQRTEEHTFAIECKLNNWGIPENALSGGDLGKIYGKQWRAWEDIRIVPIEDWAENWKAYRDRGFDAIPEGYFEYDDRVNDRPFRTHAIIKREIDQVAQVEKAIAERSDSRRIILTGWNVAQLDEMSLPPCHTLAQWYVSQQTDEEGRNFLDVELYQRSNDMFLGCPFNVAQYALITEMLAHVHGLRARMLYHTIGDAHIYLNHIEGPDSVTELLKRPIIHNSPKLVIAPGEYKSILDIPNSAVTMEGYESHPAFKNVPIAK